MIDWIDEAVIDCISDPLWQVDFITSTGAVVSLDMGTWLYLKEPETISIHIKA